MQASAEIFHLAAMRNVPFLWGVLSFRSPLEFVLREQMQAAKSVLFSVNEVSISRLQRCVKLAAVVPIS